VVTNVHRVLGIVNGTCNFMLTRIAFGSQVTLDSVVYAGIEGLRAEHLRPAKKLDMVVRLVGSASLVDAKVDVISARGTVRERTRSPALRHPKGAYGEADD
jgi:homoserine dehydrogenase